jgi:phospholipid/cholesterol/gamma-HCH transport system substrate-binding protein
MNSERNTERKVGVFVFLGIVIICVMVIYFGKVGDRFRSGIPITVEYNNVGNLVPGAHVLYSGVLVGKVDHVRLVPDRGGVDVEINLFTDAKIRKDAHFTIKQSSLLGDQQVIVIPSSTTESPLEPGDRIKGVEPLDLNEVANQAGEAIRKLNQAIEKLSDEFIQKDSIDNLKRGLKNLADLGEKLESNSDSLNKILGSIQKGQGTVGKLITDDALFLELRQLIHNWRVHGLLYREKSDEQYPAGSKKGGYPGNEENESEKTTP